MAIDRPSTGHTAFFKDTWTDLDAQRCRARILSRLSAWLTCDSPRNGFVILRGAYGAKRSPIYGANPSGRRINDENHTYFFAIVRNEHSPTREVQ